MTAPADPVERAHWHLKLVEPMHVFGEGFNHEDEDDRDIYNQPDLTCEHCSGTGGDPWNDGITPCEFCDGEGYQWWM